MPRDPSWVCIEKSTLIPAFLQRASCHLSRFSLCRFATQYNTDTDHTLNPRSHGIRLVPNRPAPQILVKSLLHSPSSSPFLRITPSLITRIHSEFPHCALLNHLSHLFCHYSFFGFIVVIVASSSQLCVSRNKRGITINPATRSNIATIRATTGDTTFVVLSRRRRLCKAKQSKQYEGMTCLWRGKAGQTVC